MKTPQRYSVPLLVGGIVLSLTAAVVLAQFEDELAPRSSVSHQALDAVQASPHTNKYLRAQSCSGCHSKQGDFPDEVLERVCLTEYLTWRDADRHKTAYASLSSDRGLRIGRLLKKDVFAADTGCVQCHGLGADLPEGVYDQSTRRALLENGVSCESCHGPSTNWLTPHHTIRQWSQRTSLDEKTSMGWIEVRSPVTRAELCLSCHQGSDAYGRVITHEMYAAGHPPLSGFEIESFIDKMPRHWRYSYEKPHPAAGATAEPSFDRTRNLLIASVVALRMAVEMAVADATAPTDAARWPEFARLDCFACHHDVSERSWRQLRQASGSPGRPQLSVGCLPLVKLAAELAADRASEDIAAILGRLREPFAVHVFGDPLLLERQATAVVAWCEQLERRMEAMGFDSAGGRDLARTVLRRIAEAGAAELHDYDAARQLFGAWRVVYEELDKNNAIHLSNAHQEKLLDNLRRIDERDPLVLQRDRMMLPCDPPPGDSAAAQTSEQREAILGQIFANRIQYDPASFANLMATLGELTKE